MLLASVYLALGAVAIHCGGDEGLPSGLLLLMCRSLFFLACLGMGRCYAVVLEKYDTLPNVPFFAILFTLQLAGIAALHGLYTYIPSWCQFPAGILGTYFVTITGIAFLLRCCKLLAPAFGRSRFVAALADNTFSIMCHHIFGFFLICSLFGLLSMVTPYFASFDYSAYLSDWTYRWMPEAVPQTSLVYVSGGIFVSLVIHWGWVRIKGRWQKIWSSLINKRCRAQKKLGNEQGKRDLAVGRCDMARTLPSRGRSLCSGPFENRQNGPKHAKSIQIQRAVGDVVVLQVQSLVVLDVRASIASPPAREAGLHLVVQRPSAVLLKLSRNEGTRANDGHVAGHDVEELGQLVERCLAQDAAHASDAGVIVQLLAPVPLLAPLRILEQFCQYLVGVPYHGAQLPKLEGFAPQADVRLLVEDGMVVADGEVGDLHDGGDGQGDRAAGDAQQQGECALAGEVDGLRGAEGMALQIERLHDADLSDLLHFRGNAEGFREADAHLEALGHEFLDGRVVHLRGSSQDDDLVRVGERAEGQQVGAGGGGSLEEHVDRGGVGEAEADDAGGLHVVGVKALLGFFGVLRRADEHDALDAVLWAIAPAREEPPLVQVLQNEGEARIARVHDDDHFA